MIQCIENSRIFAQVLLKIVPSRARFAMPGCYIKGLNNNKIEMRKNFRFRVFALLMMTSVIFVITGCQTAPKVIAELTDHYPARLPVIAIGTGTWVYPDACPFDYITGHLQRRDYR